MLSQLESVGVFEMPQATPPSDSGSRSALAAGLRASQFKYRRLALRIRYAFRLQVGERPRNC